jgi:hypothetical protein
MAKPERRKPVGRARVIWKDNIEIYIGTSTGCQDANWIHFAQERNP